MSLFGNLTTEGLEESQDRLGGYQVKPTGAYLGKIKLAYAGKSDGGAQNVTLVLDINGQDYTETIYITNKQGENFFLNKQDNSKKIPLPGFTTIDELCLVTTEKPLSQQDAEEKIVKIYDYNEKKEVPKSVPVLTELLGKEAYFAIVSEIQNKNVKNDSTGAYEPTAETREQNVIEKVFHYPTKLTIPEARQQVTEPAFYEAWVAKNADKQRDRRTVKDGETGVKSGRPGGGAPAAGAAKAATSSLFKK